MVDDVVDEEDCSYTELKSVLVRKLAFSVKRYIQSCSRLSSETLSIKIMWLGISI